MSEANTAAVADGPDEGKLAELNNIMTEAVEFADRWPALYKSRAFDLAIERLLAGTPTSVRSIGGGQATPVTSIITGGLSAVARDLGLDDPRSLSRAVEVTDDGKVSVLGRIEARTKADLQLLYSAVYCYLVEKALGKLDTPIDDLRSLCQRHNCYDGGNFTQYFRRSDLFRELGDKGARAYRLSIKGVDEAKALLKKMVEE
jgi:hypothetical protein